jgi:hypothetical protein
MGHNDDAKLWSKGNSSSAGILLYICLLKGTLQMTMADSELGTTDCGAYLTLIESLEARFSP